MFFNKKIIPYVKGFLAFVLLSSALPAWAMTKGIYITQYMLESNNIAQLIKEAKSAGIDTFVVDYERPSKLYSKHIALVNQSGLRYVARVIMFPDGGRRAQIRSEAYWEKRWELIQQAYHLGAKEIQLDYIRYHVGTPSSDQNAVDIHKVIKWVKAKTDKLGVPLQLDVFGETGFHPSRSIGQDVALFAPDINVLNPMVYPSHFEPYKKWATQPYRIIHLALKGLKEKFQGGKLPFKLYPYIELSNYRYPMSTARRLVYIKEQLRAVKEANANGWYAWSPHNRYQNLFTVLKEESKQTASSKNSHPLLAIKPILSEKKEPIKKEAVNKAVSPQAQVSDSTAADLAS